MDRAGLMNKMSDAFDDYWSSSFPGCPPISYLFKWRMPDRWLRVHSLPNSKRYPESDKERGEVLRRQKLLLADVVGIAEECFFVGAAFGDLPTVAYCGAVPDLGEILTNPARRISHREVEKDDDEPVGIWDVEVGKGRLDIDRLKLILLKIADDQLSHFFVVNPKLNRIFAPYDGGVDLILEDSEQRDALRTVYSDWCSARSDRL